MSETLGQKELSIKLVRLYIFALCAVAIFSIIGQILIQYAINQQQSDAKVINMAGRQRMLSQRLCKTTILMGYQEIYLPDAEYYSKDLAEIIELWETNHNGLKNGNLNPNNFETRFENSLTIDSLFSIIDPIFKVMLSNAKIINEEYINPTANSNEIIKTSLKHILKNERTFLKLMDKIVQNYQTEAKSKLDTLKFIEMAFFILTMLVLIFEGLFIYLPSYKQINQTINHIEVSRLNLKTVNDQLKNSNETLTKTRIELLAATEEKYRLLIQKDKIRTSALLEGQEEERKRLSLELHDGIGQMLTGLKLIAEKINIDNLAVDKERKSFIDLKKLIDDTIAEIRTISFNLMPSILNDFGVLSAIKYLIEQTEKNSSIKIYHDLNLRGIKISKNIEITIYRIIQEALNNAVKHAQATEIKLKVLCNQNDLTIDYADNGKGFDKRILKSKNLKNGLNNMKSRIEIHNGNFKISSVVGKGTKINIKLPLDFNINHT